MGSRTMSSVKRATKRFWTSKLKSPAMSMAMPRLRRACSILRSDPNGMLGSLSTVLKRRLPE
eukprot:2161114-Amphidinium_carterae.1